MPCIVESYSASVGIGHSQGRLYVTHVHLFNACQLSVWALEDYNSKQWTLKHSVRILELFGRHQRSCDEFYDVIAIHPERNLVFIIGRTMKRRFLMSYDMDNLRVQIICPLDEYSLGTCAPYVPYFGELQLSEKVGSTSQLLS
ncbi:hypothetical protein HU200_018230 [Digitaria exilis]|uniref:F-box associated domain-containing protein n=1 Tax=Digitaria exilis TaxID=1010633 RepID=A0A835F5L6_9POAL|nr:hypothetical protein HU200_018230 [Digitaria exilis]